MSQSESLSESLRNVDVVSDDEVEHLREQVLEAIDVPEGFEEFGEPELQTDGSTWTLVSFEFGDDQFRYIELLEESNYLQVWDEDEGPVSEPTWDAEDVSEALASD